MTLGFGLMILLDDKSSVAEQELVTLVASLGIGCLFQPPLIGEPPFTVHMLQSDSMKCPCLQASKQPCQ